MKMTLNFYKYNSALYKILINKQLAQCAVALKCWFIWIRLWVGTHKSLKTKEKSSWVIPKAIAVAYNVKSPTF